MAHRAEQYEDVPDGVEVAPAVVRKEISAAGVENALCQDEEQGSGREPLKYGFGDEHHRPAQHKVEHERELGVAVDGDYLIHRAAYHHRPEQSEHRPAQSAAHYADADGCVGRRYHDVDAYVVEDAEPTLCAARFPPMVERTAGEHDEHAAGEECNAESVAPAGAVAQLEDEPCQGEREYNAGQVGQRVEYFFFRALKHKRVEVCASPDGGLVLGLQMTLIERIVAQNL